MAERSIICSVCLRSPPSLQCACVDPKVLLCYQCIPKHFQETRQHDIQLYVVPNPHNVQCELCTVSEAVQMCVCKEVATPLCLPCSQKHRVTEFCDEHPFFDIKAYPHFAPGFANNLKAKQSGVREALNQLKEILNSMELVEATINRHFEELTAIIARYREEKLNELRKLREEFQQTIEKATQEVAEHIYEREYYSEDRLVNDIWNFSTQPASFHCFDFVSDSYSASQTIKKSVYFKLEISRRSLTPSVIPVLRGNAIHNWDARLKMWNAPTTLSQTINFSRHCAWALIGQGQIAVSGGRKTIADCLRCAYLIDRKTGQVEELPPMMTARANHTLIYIDNSICAFGGSEICEMLRFGTGKWEALPNMREYRSYCTGCIHNNSIYLSGGYGTNITERFDWETKTFTTLAFNTDNKLFATSFVLYDELIAVDIYNVYRWSLSSGVLRKKKTQPTACDWSNCSAIVANGNVYLVTPSNIVELTVSETEVSISEYSIPPSITSFSF